MNPHFRKLTLVALPVFVAAGAVALWSYTPPGEPAGRERRIAYYQDSMHPWVKSERPGKCTICSMDLTPIYEGDAGFGENSALVTLRPAAITVTNVATDVVTRSALDRTLRVAGVLEADNARKTIVAAPAPGRIDNITVESAGIDVEKGAVLATFYSPDLTFQTRRYIFRDRMTDHAGQSALASPFGGSSRHQPNPGAVSRNQPLNSQERGGADPYFNDLLSTLSGTVVERNVFEGQYVAEGDRLFTVVDTAVLWFRFDVYEHQLAWLEVGQPIDVTVQSIPGRVFPAEIAIVEPAVDPLTRTVKVRADVQNPLAGAAGGDYRQLRLGMYAEGRLRARIPDVLTVPSEAVLFPGGQAFVYVDRGGGGYEQRPVQLGRKGDGRIEVLAGLGVGERVVTSGNVLIDAEAQFIRGVSARTMLASTTQDSSATHVPEPVAVSAPAVLAQDPAGDRPVESVHGLALNPPQQEVLTRLLAAAEGIAAALAADNVEATAPHAAALPALVARLDAEFPANDPWHQLVDAVSVFARDPEVADLEGARRWFVRFSASVVGLVGQLRSSDPRYREMKVYHCPMAPEPGLWFQRNGPLQNPFYGSQMLTCGEEVSLPAPGFSTPQLAEVPAARGQPEASGMSEPGMPLAAAGAPVDPAPADVDNSSGPARPHVSRAPREPRHGASNYDKAATNIMARFAATPANSPEQSTAPELVAEAETEVSSDGPPAGDPSVQEFLSLVDGMTAALAGDDLVAFNTAYAGLPGVLGMLEQNFPAPPRTNSMIRRLSVLSRATPARTLEEVRKRYVLFSMNAVQLARQWHDEGQAPEGFKVFRCPETSGVWLQVASATHNPYLGLQNPTCGEEVDL